MSYRVLAGKNRKAPEPEFGRLKGSRLLQRATVLIQFDQLPFPRRNE
jgi:hypothetical protein